MKGRAAGIQNTITVGHAPPGAKDIKATVASEVRKFNDPVQAHLEIAT